MRPLDRVFHWPQANRVPVQVTAVVSAAHQTLAVPAQPAGNHAGGFLQVEAVPDLQAQAAGHEFMELLVAVRLEAPEQ